MRSKWFALLASTLVIIALAIVGWMVSQQHLRTRRSRMHVRRGSACVKEGCKPDCEAGDLVACHRLAQMSVTSKGAPPEVTKKFQQLCEQGVGASCWTFGDMTRLGLGVPRSEESGNAIRARGVQLTRFQCDDGDAWACQLLGEMYARGGAGLPQSEADAARAFERARLFDRMLCRWGNTGSCLVLGGGYSGQLKTLSHAESEEVFGYACREGHWPACAWQRYHTNTSQYAEKDPARLNQGYRLQRVPETIQYPRGAIASDVHLNSAVIVLGVSLFDHHGNVLNPLVPIQVGVPIRIRTYFKVEKPVAGTYQIAFHLENGSGRVTGDHPPMGGLLPTSSWRSGDILVDTYEIRATPEIDGVCLLYLMLFDPSDGHRLKVTGVRGVIDDQILITTLKVQ